MFEQCPGGSWAGTRTTACALSPFFPLWWSSGTSDLTFSEGGWGMRGLGRTRTVGRRFGKLHSIRPSRNLQQHRLCVYVLMDALRPEPDEAFTVPPSCASPSLHWRKKELHIGSLHVLQGRITTTATPLSPSQKQTKNQNQKQKPLPAPPLRVALEEKAGQHLPLQHSFQPSPTATSKSNLQTPPC